MFNQIVHSNDEKDYIDYICNHCNEVIAETDSLYIRDYPLASTGWLNSQKDIHDEHVCSVLNKW